MANTLVPPFNTFNMPDGATLERVAPIHSQIDRDSSFVGLKRLPALRTVARYGCESATSSTPIKAEATEPEVAEPKLNAVASRRERCRINQARYRKRQRQKADELDKSIRELQTEIQDLQAIDRSSCKLRPRRACGSSLAARMLNQRLVVPGSVRFDWDSASGRVSRLESRLDMLTPMLKLLGSLEAVACVFDRAAITLEGRIVQ